MSTAIMPTVAIKRWDLGPVADTTLKVAAARALKPIHERQVLSRSILIFDLKFDSNSNHLDRQQLAALGEVRTPGIADLFVAVMGGKAGEAQGAAQ